MMCARIPTSNPIQQCCSSSSQLDKNPLWFWLGLFGPPVAEYASDEYLSSRFPYATRFCDWAVEFWKSRRGSRRCLHSKSWQSLLRAASLTTRQRCSELLQRGPYETQRVGQIPTNSDLKREHRQEEPQLTQIIRFRFGELLAFVSNDPIRTKISQFVGLQRRART